MNSNVVKILLNFKNKGRVENTIDEVPKNHKPLDNLIEAEKGEVVITYDDKGLSFPKIYEIKGKKHKDGGTDLDLPDNSFIFSDSKEMVIKDPDILKLFGEEKPKTFAQIAKKYLFNESSKIIEDDIGDSYAKNRALNDIDNKMGKLALLGIIQEKSKGNDIPTFARIYFMTKGINIDELQNKNKESSSLTDKLPKAELGLNVGSTGSDLTNVVLDWLKKNGYVIQKAENQQASDPNNKSSQSSVQSSTDAQRSNASQVAQADNNIQSTANNQNTASQNPFLDTLKDYAQKPWKLAYKPLIDMYKVAGKAIGHTMTHSKGGMNFMNELETLSGISERMTNMYNNYATAKNNPVNTDTTQPVFNLSDKGDYVTAGSQYGQFRPNQQNPTAAFAYGVPNPLVGGYVLSGGINLYDKGGETPNTEGNTGDKRNELKQIIENKLKEIYEENDDRFKEVKNTFEKYLDKITLDENAIKQIKENIESLNLQEIKDKLFENVGINDESIKNNIISTNLLNIIRSAAKNKEGKIPIMIKEKKDDTYEYRIEYKTESELNKKKNGKFWYEQLDENQTPIIFADDSFNSNDPKVISENTKQFQIPFYNKNISGASKVDGIPGSKTTTQNHLEKFKQNPKVEKTEKPKDPTKPQLGRAGYTSAPVTEPKAKPINTLAKEKQEKLERQLDNLRKATNRSYSFYVQDTNLIGGALANLANIKKYMPYESTGDAILGRPVFYSPDRQIQQVQQSATQSLKTAQNTLPANLVNAYASAIQGSAADQSANIIGNISNANVGLANQYEQTKASVLSGLADRIAQTQNLAYKENVIANQQFDDAKKKAYANLIAAYNNALKNMANRVTANTVYLANGPFYVDEYGAIRFNPEYKPDVAGSYIDYMTTFENLVSYINSISGLTAEQKSKIIEEYLKKYPEFYEYFNTTYSASPERDADVEHPSNSTQTGTNNTNIKTNTQVNTQNKESNNTNDNNKNPLSSLKRYPFTPQTEKNNNLSTNVVPDMSLLLDAKNKPIETTGSEYFYPYFSNKLNIPNKINNQTQYNLGGSVGDKIRKLAQLLKR